MRISACIQSILSVHRIRFVHALSALGLSALACIIGCSSPVTRADEIHRFQDEMQRRWTDLKIDPAEPLTMDQCVAIALQNSLDYRVRKLHETLQDDKVRISLSGGLPQVTGQYSNTWRNNAAQQQLGPITAEIQDKHLQNLSIAAVVPVLDWGETYYAWQIAKDRRTQERLEVRRAGQTLVRDVQVAYARLAGLQRQEKLARVGLLAARELLRTAQSLEREGLGAHAETASVEAELAQAAQQWSALRRNVEQARMALSQLLSLAPGAALNIVEALPPVRPLLAPAEIPAIEASALSKRPELDIEDRELRVAADTVRQQFAQFLPRLDGLGSYNWSSQSGLVHPGFFQFGFQVTETLLNGGRNIWQYRLDKKAVKVEEERALLLSLGILYDVDFRVLQLYTVYDSVVAHAAIVHSQQEALKQIISRYLQGFESGIDAAQSLATMYLARLQLDQVQTDYQVAGYELDAATLYVPPEGAPAAEKPFSGFEPAAPLDSLRKMLEAAPPIDLRQYPELDTLLKPK